MFAHCFLIYSRDLQSPETLTTVDRTGVSDFLLRRELLNALAMFILLYELPTLRHQPIGKQLIRLHLQHARTQSRQSRVLIETLVLTHGLHLEFYVLVYRLRYGSE